MMNPILLKKPPNDDTNFVSNSVIDLEIAVIPETQKMSLLPMDSPTTLKWLTKSNNYENNQSFIFLKNIFLKEIETMKTFTKLVKKKFVAE